MNGGMYARVTALTHEGRVRTHNEDTIVVGRWIRNAPMSAPMQFIKELDPPLLCLVADGMGGHAAGEEASRLVASRLSEQPIPPTDEEVLGTLLRDLNSSVFDAMAESDHLRGMGTTVVGMVVSPNAILHFNVGDSRLYRFRDGFLRLLSVDDVPVSFPDDNSASVGSRRSHGITQALGGAEAHVEIAPHVGTETLAVGRRYLLCSDGLTDMLGVEEIEARIGSDDAQSVAALFEAALEAGGEDNISLVLVSIETAPSDGDPLDSA